MEKERLSHPAFPQPGDPSVTLWRYMDIHKFQWLVVCQRLLMARADRLGDQLEGTRPRGDLDWWLREAANADSDQRRSIIEHNRQFLSRMARAFREQYYVSCWHMNEFENRAMWACYTPGTTEAVAIRTSYEALRACLPACVNMGMVRYIDYSNERLPTMNMFEYIMHKDSYYSYEREVRAVAFPPVVDEIGGADFHASHFESESEAGFLVYAPPVELGRLIHGVVLHPDATASFETTMIDLCAKNDLPRPEVSRRTHKPVF